MRPNTPGQPNRRISKTVAPMAKTGKLNALKKMASLISITPRSLANKFVILPSCELLMTYEVSDDILA